MALTLRSKLQRAVTEANRENPSERAVSTAIEDLAITGRNTLGELVDDEEVLHSLIDFLAQPSAVQAYGDYLQIPWEALYIRREVDSTAFRGDGPPDLSGFLGHSHSIHRALAYKALRGNDPRALRYRGKPQIGAVNERLRHFAREDWVRDEFLDDDDFLRKFDVVELDELDPTELDHGTNQYIAFARDRSHTILHHATHGCQKERPGEDFFNACREFPIEADKIPKKKLRLLGSPFAVLNFCQSGQLRVGREEGFALRFLKAGAKGALATECDVPVSLADGFVAEFYEQLRSGQTASQSLLKAREDQLRTGNPAAFIYSLYGVPDLVLREGS